MPSIRFGARFTSALFLVSLLACGAGGGLEGSYYNTVTGDFAFELRSGGRIFTASGEEDPNLKYVVRGDEVALVARDGSEGELVMKREKDGVLSLGPLGSVKKR